MSDFELVGQVRHLTQQLQSQLAAVENGASTPGLHWGQFVVAGRTNSQVGVYGSSCAAIILRLDQRDDAVARAAVQNLMDYTASPNADTELAHNIKLAMLCLALAPLPGVEASVGMLRHLDTLTARYMSAAHLWPAYTRPARFQAVQFTERPSEVASAVIAIMLDEVRRRLSHQAHVGLCGQIDAMLKQTAAVLADALAARRTSATRHSSLIATAVILAKEKKVPGAISAAFKDAVQKRDFADRRVFFYDCLRIDSSPSRDYFILPAATLLPLVADARNASAMQRALALDVAPTLLTQLGDDGVFKGGQDLPSTVEQALVALSLNAIPRAISKRTLSLYLSQAWLYVTQPSPSGTPTKLVYALVFLLWAATVIIVGGKYMPEQSRTVRWIAWIYSASKESPEAVAQFLPFVAAAWPASRAAFMRFIGVGRP